MFWEEENWDKFAEIKNIIKTAAFENENEMIRKELPSIEFDRGTLSDRLFPEFDKNNLVTL